MKLEERFETLSLLGEGAFGRVLEVRERSTGAHRALKLVSVRGDPARAEREIAASLRVRHEHVLRAFEGAVEGDRAWVLLELAAGSLEDVLGDPARRAEAWRLLREAGRGVAALHREGLVHRDLKPANVLLVDGRAKVSDLGLARGADMATLTATGTIMGTPAYMAPEQARGERAGPAADTWALGAMLFEVLEGRPPHPPGLATGELLTRVARGERDPFAEARGRYPAALLAQVEQAMAPPPDERPPDVGDWIEDLGELPAPGRVESAATVALPGGPRATRLHPGPAKDATAPLGRAPLPSPAAASASGPTPRIPRAALVGVGLLLATLGYWLGGSSEPGPGPTPAPSAPPTAAPATPAPATETPFGPEFQHQLEKDLEEVLDMTPEDAGNPHLWGRYIERSPALQEFQAWLAAGGHPEELPSARREELRALDHRFEAHGFPPPFHPSMYLEPSPGAEPVPRAVARTLTTRQTYFSRQEVDDVYRLPVPRATHGWGTLVLRSYQEVVDETERILGEVKGAYSRGETPYTDMFARYNARARVAREPEDPIDFWRKLDRAYHTSSGARVLTEYMAAGRRPLNELLFAAFRSAGEEGDQGVFSCLVASTVLLTDEKYLFGPRAHADPYALLGGTPRTAAQAFLAAQLLDRLAEVRKETFVIGVRPPELMEQVRRSLADSVRWSAEARSFAGTRLFAAALIASMEDDLDAGRLEDLLARQLRYRERLEGFPGEGDVAHRTALAHAMLSLDRMDALPPAVHRANLARLEQIGEARLQGHMNFMGGSGVQLATGLLGRYRAAVEALEP